MKCSRNMKALLCRRALETVQNFYHPIRRWNGRALGVDYGKLLLRLYQKGTALSQTGLFHLRLLMMWKTEDGKVKALQRQGRNCLEHWILRCQEKPWLRRRERPRKLVEASGRTDVETSNVVTESLRAMKGFINQMVQKVSRLLCGYLAKSKVSSPPESPN